MVLILSRWATGERFLVWPQASPQTSNSTNYKLEVILVDISHQVGNLALIWKNFIFVDLIFAEYYKPLDSKQYHKDKLHEDIDVCGQVWLNVASSSSNDLVDQDNYHQYKYTNTAIEWTNGLKDVFIRAVIPDLS